MGRRKWWVIARNEYMLMTSSLPSIRRILPLLLICLTFLFLLVLAPSFVGLIENEILIFIVSQAAVPSISIILLTFVFYFMVIPITNTLREEQASELEIFLSAPVRSEDFILGKFLGKLMVYGTGALIIAGFAAAIFTVVGIGIAQLLIITFLIFILLISGFWIGTVIASVLRARLSKTARGTDMGKALSMIIVLPLLALMYAFISGALFNSLEDPSTAGSVESLLAIFPTTWAAEVIINFAQNPGFLLSDPTLTSLSICGIVIFTLASFYLGFKAVGKVYTLEPTKFGVSMARREGVGLKVARRITGSGSFSVIVVTMFKDWGRRLENISKMAYMFGLIFLLAFFFAGPEDPYAVVFLLQFMIAFMAVLMVSETTVRGKDSLFLYRKAPGGERRLVKARLILGWIVVVPVAFLLTLLFMLFTPESSLQEVLLYPLFMAISGMAVTVFSLGLFLIKPAFSDKSGEFVINMMATIFIFFLLIILSDLLLGILGLLVIYLPLAWLMGGLTISLGTRNLKRME